MLTAVLALSCLFLVVLLAIAVGAYSDLAAENRRLRGDHLTLIHPARRPRPTLPDPGRTTR